MLNTSGLLKNNFQSPTHACSSYHEHNFWMPELPLATLNLSLQIRYMLLLKKIAGTYFSTFPMLKILKVTNGTSWKTLLSMRIAT